MKSSFEEYTRDQWRSFNQTNPENVISASELADLTSLGDRINLDDVWEIYRPLVEYLHLYYQQKLAFQKAKADFVKVAHVRKPFIIGISGSVAVGKSTTARLITLMLKRLYPELRAQLMTTDGFLYTNAELAARNLTERKGFPESYDMQKLYEFLSAVAAGQPDVKFPLYSHQVYDILPGEYGHVEQPDILIVEGINVLQLPTNEELFIADFFDQAIYLDADEKLIEQWFLERFRSLRELAQNDADDFYYHFAQMPDVEAMKIAEDVWQNVNLLNLREYIAPTKTRANIILHKTKQHQIDKIFLRKY